MRRSILAEECVIVISVQVKTETAGTMKSAFGLRSCLDEPPLYARSHRLSPTNYHPKQISLNHF